MTDKAFHENWYLFKPSIKRIFILIIMANNLECKIATFENFNLSLPSFMVVRFFIYFYFVFIYYTIMPYILFIFENYLFFQILNQSYSISLLFLKMK